MTPEEKHELEDTLNKAEALLKGQIVGVPKQQSMGRFPVTQSDV
jgi:hypothetical protein